MAVVGIDSSSLRVNSWPKSLGFGPRVVDRLVQCCIYQMNLVSWHN